MDTIVRRLFEQHRLIKEDISSEDRKNVESHLKYHLGSYETGVSVDNVELVSETPNSKTFKVSYEVSIQIPYWDSDAETEYYEYDKEYREHTLTLSKEELSESLSPEEDADLVYLLTTLKTESREAIDKYEMEDLGECKAILQYLVRDSQKALELVSKM